MRKAEQKRTETRSLRTEMKQAVQDYGTLHWTVDTNISELQSIHKERSLYWEVVADNVYRKSAPADVCKRE